MVAEVWAEPDETTAENLKRRIECRASERAPMAAVQGGRYPRKDQKTGRVWQQKNGQSQPRMRSWGENGELDVHRAYTVVRRKGKIQECVRRLIEGPGPGMPEVNIQSR
jgi:hypothetical protein